MTDQRTLRRALMLGALIACVAAPRALSAQQRHGDVNRDGVVSALDAQAILTQVVGLPIPPAYMIADGDSNCDAATGALDAQIVLSYVIGLNVSQYCVGQPFGAATIRVDITPTNDTSLLVNRGIRLRAVLTDPEGFLIQRPVTWTTSNADLVSIDSARGDTAWVSNHFTTTGAADASATLTAFADGAQGARVIKVFRSYAGIVIVPQRPDTLRQLNGVTQFHVRGRDSLGNVTDHPNAVWSSGAPAVAAVPGTASNQHGVTALTMGSTYLYATSAASPTVRDSVRLTVQLQPQNTCTGVGGTLHGTETHTTPQTWTAAGNPHYVHGSLTFNAGSRLTIEAGALVCGNTAGYVYFNNGSRLLAEGTAAQPIRFETTTGNVYWGGLFLGQSDGSAAPPTDTSRIAHATISDAYYGLYNYQRHVVTIEDTRIRAFWSNALTLQRQGSRFLRSSVDTGATGHGTSTAVVLYRGAVEESILRLGGTDHGIQLYDSATVRQVSILDPIIGIAGDGGADGARLNDVTISRPSGTALEILANLHPASSGVQIQNGSGGAFRGSIQNLGLLFGDSVAQAGLLGHGRDTVFITGGILENVQLESRRDLPWVVSAVTYIDTLAQLVPRPGSRFLFNYGGLIFQRGGRMTAVGTSLDLIHFSPGQGGVFYGLRFDSPGAGGIPANAPVAVSTMNYVRVDSAQSLGSNDGIGYNAAVYGARRHRLFMDSTVMLMSYYAGAVLAAPGSIIRRSVVDTTGPASNNFVGSQPALILGDSVLVENTLVRRSGQIGLYALGTHVDLRNVRVVASLDRGLSLEGGVLAPTTTGVRADSANSYPFYGRIENLAIVAGTGALQTANLMGNVNNRLILSGGTLANATLEAHRDLPWRVDAQTNVDTLAQLRPLPGASLTFQNGGFIFQRGGTLSAVGTATDTIRFRSDGNNAFYGLRFDSPGAGGVPANAPVAVSTMNYVQIDSAQGQSSNDGIGYTAGVYGARRHRVQIENALLRKSYYAAAVLAAPQSYLRGALIDTTGPASSNYVASYPALILGDTVLVENTLVRRSGQIGLYALGAHVDLRNVRVVASLDRGLSLEGGVLAPTTTGLRADSANSYPFYGRIENLAIVAGTGALQTANLMGNNSNLLIVSGGTLSNATLQAHRDLPWRIDAQTHIDTLAQLEPLPGASLTFQNGGLIFQRGGTLNAVGTPADFIRFRSDGTSAFYGLRFDSPGAGGVPANAPVAVSTLNYVRIDSAQGQSSNDGIGYIGAIYGARRHRVGIDSAVIRKSYYAAAILAAPQSYLRGATIDTTGPASANYVASYPALILGDTVLVENTLVRRSGQVGLYALGTRVDLRNVRVVASLDRALSLEGGVLAPTSTGVRADSANSYPFYGRIENLAIVAPSADEQAAQLLGNVDGLIIVSGGTLTGTGVEVHRDLRWRVDANLQFGAGSELRPRAGARLTFQNGGLWFQGGGRLLAQGAQGDTVYFTPVPGQTFLGIRFDDATQVDFPSILSYARIDSASGQGVSVGFGSGGQAAVNSSTSHVLHVSNTRIARSRQSALFLGAIGSSANDVEVDTTGTGATFTASWPAVELNDDVSATNLLVRRSGNTGIEVHGSGITMSGVRVVDSRINGIHVTEAPSGLVLSGFVVDSTQATGTGVIISANNVQLTGCDVLNSFATGIATNSNYSGVQVHDCNILNNGRGGAGLGISNNNTTNAAFEINADDNFWGLDGAGAPITPAVGAVNGISPNVRVQSIRPTQRVP